MGNLKWNDTDRLLVLELYLKYRPQIPTQKNNELLEISKKIGKTPGSIKMLCQNFQYLDTGRGLPHTGDVIKKFWNKHTQQKHIAMVANIVYNPMSWREALPNSNAGHSYARKNVPHESLNFIFHKQNIDTNKEIYGYFQRTHEPLYFINGGMIVFFTRNTDNKKNEIVGLYGKAQITRKEFPHSSFENGRYLVNIVAERDYSILFPIPLNADKYKIENKRLVGQMGFTYKGVDFIKGIIQDELTELSKNGVLEEEYNKLIKIYEYYTKENYKDYLEREQEELERAFKQKSKEELKKEISNSLEQKQEYEIINGKRYKRDTANIARIKKLREHKCQICGISIVKKNGGLYTEAAHITPKCDGGSENLDNIIVLCPNHHTEFDLGNRKELYRDKVKIEFILNEKKYSVDLN